MEFQLRTEKITCTHAPLFTILHVSAAILGGFLFTYETVGGGELVLGAVVDLLTGRGLQGESPRASPQLWLLCCPYPHWRRLHHQPHVLRPSRAVFLDPQACAGRKRQQFCVVTPCPAGRPPPPTWAPCQEHTTSAPRLLPVTPHSWLTGFSLLTKLCQDAGRST